VTAATARAPAARIAHPPPRRRPRLLSAFFWLLIALLYLPIAILFIFSINDGTSLSLPLRGFTLEWYERLLSSAPLLRAVMNSLLVAAGASTVATVLGTMVAILFSRFKFRGRSALAGLAILPLIVPYVVLGVSLLILFKALDIPLSMATVIVGHAIVALPYTALIVLARLIGSEPQLEEAAMDLGATYPSTLRLVVIPMAMPAIVSAWITAFTVSFDEFAIALFLAGKDTTFPVYLYGQLRFANTLPVLIAGAVLLMVGTLVMVLLAERIRRR
jgi:spermidine/putrescine transport system permease protein